MVKKIVREWKDGDSGIFTDGTEFRLSNVRSPEKNEPGYALATTRSRRLIKPADIIDVKTVGKDKYKRDIVEVRRQGRDINKILEMKNKLFEIKPPK